MSNDAASPDDAWLLQALTPLRAIDPSERVTAAPQRLPLDSERECLVIWQSDSGASDWTLVLYSRPIDSDDTETPVARLALRLPAGDTEPTAYWDHADDAFRQWVTQNLSGIVTSLAAGQPLEREALRQRAGLNQGLAQKLGEMLPHVIVLAGIAAFAYMFGIVHIK